MKNLSLVLALSLIAGVAVSAKVLGEDRPAPVKLGFVDVKKAFETYRKHADEMERIRTKSGDFVKELKQRAAAVEQLEGKLTQLNTGTPDYAEVERRVYLEKASIEFDRKNRARELENEQRKKRTLIYKEICLEAGAYAQEHGLAAVFSYIPPEAEIEQDLDLIVPTRDLLWRDEQLDLTTEIVDRLNRSLPPAAPKPGDAPKDGNAPSTPPK